MLAIICDNCDYSHTGITVPKRARRLAQAHAQDFGHTVRMFAKDLSLEMYRPHPVLE